MGVKNLNLEKGTVIGLESITVYESCNTCKSKVNNNKCGKCDRLIEDQNTVQSAVAKMIVIDEEDNCATVTLFTDTLKKIAAISPQKEAMEEEIVEKLPLQIEYSLSPNKIVKTLKF